MVGSWGRLAGCLLLVGCAAHVDLRAPPAIAPVEARVDAYNQLRGLSYHSTTTTTYGTFGAGMASHSIDYLQLANGTRVYYPEDLIPVVAEDSPPAKAAEASVSKRGTARLLTLGAVLSVAAGIALAVLPIATAKDGNVNGTPILFGLGIGIFGGVGFSIAAHFVGESAQDEAATTYETYDRGLLERLNLCESGADSVAACRR